MENEWLCSHYPGNIPTVVTQNGDNDAEYRGRSGLVWCQKTIMSKKFSYFSICKGWVIKGMMWKSWSNTNEFVEEPTRKKSDFVLGIHSQFICWRIVIDDVFWFSFLIKWKGLPKPPHFPLYCFRKEVDKNEETIQSILKEQQKG